MKKIFFIALFICVSLAFKANDKIAIKDFAPAFGKWKGTLTYLDYKSGKPYTMPANVTITENALNKYQLILAYEYPKEPKANGNDTLTVGEDGIQLNKAKVISKRKQANDIVEIITEENGKDGNDHKLALIKKIYLTGKNHFSIQKDVQFEGETTWIKRDIFSFER